MKILHTADIHLGVKNGKLSKDKQNLLKDETIYNIRHLFEIAKEENYDVILICGDLFHSKTIASKFVNVFFDAVKEFENPVIYINGNHDETFILPTTVPSNFVYLDNINPVFSYGDFKFFSQYYETNLSLNVHENNILLLHGNIENTRDSDYFDINKYLNKGFDYIALGHVHQHKKYKKGKDIFAYPGCLFSNGFDEGGEKGYISLEIEDKLIKNLKNNLEIFNKIENDLKDNKVSFQDLIKVVLTGEVNEDCEKSLPLILQKFENYFYFEIQDNTTFKIDIDKIKNEKLSFKYEFISLVENSDIDAESKRLISEIGLSALKGEDLKI